MGRERAWTDEDLIAAVEQSTTIIEVLERLGVARGGGALTAVRRRMLELHLDRPDLLRHARSAKWSADPADDLAHSPVSGRWTEDELRMAVVASTSMRQVMEYLGYGGSGGAWTAAKAQILAMGLDTSHFGRTARSRSASLPEALRTRRTWSDADLTEAVEASTSIAGVIRHMGLKIGGSMYVVVKRRIGELGLDTSHFTGRGWSKGMSVTCWPGRPLNQILIENSDYQSTGALRRRLIKEGLKEARCENCGNDSWEGAPIPLQLDHINGDRTDNRIENLRILCPNCHAQTDTWCGKNIGRYDRPGSLMELADMHRSKWCAFGREGSNPSGPTIQLTFSDLDALD